MATMHHELSIDAPEARVYEALASADRIGTWWDKQTAVQTERSEFFSGDQVAWAQVLQSLKRAVEAQPG